MGMVATAFDMVLDANEDALTFEGKVVCCRPQLMRCTRSCRRLHNAFSEMLMTLAFVYYCPHEIPTTELRFPEAQSGREQRIEILRAAMQLLGQGLHLPYAPVFARQLLFHK
jgi:hypothetical protein